MIHPKVLTVFKKVFKRFCLLVLPYLAACSTLIPEVPPPNQQLPAPLRPPLTSELAPTPPNSPLLDRQQPEIRFTSTPQIPPLDSGASQVEQVEITPDLKATTPIKINVDNLPLPAFVNEVFGNLLGLSFEISPEVQAKRDLVTLRIAEARPPLDFYKMVRQVLVGYGVELEQQGGLLRFVAIDPKGLVPPSLILQGTSLPEIPPTHRSVIHFLPLKVVNAAEANGWLSNAFKGHPLVITPEPLHNALMLIGNPALIQQAAEAVRILDQPSMKGKHGMRIEPAFLSAQNLAGKLTEVLRGQGYAASGSPIGGSILILPIPETNSIIVFAADQTVLAHVQHWAEQLDRLNPQITTKPNLFFYPVKNTSASSLAATVNGLRQTTEQLSVDAQRNALLFFGNNEDWTRLLPILQEMDKPAKQVLIEATIAEITLTDKDERGIEWVIKQAGLGGLHGSLGTLNGLGVAGAGLSYTLRSGNELRAIVNAFVSSSQATILSTPRLMVQSGKTASIMVGNEIPTLTSQATTNQTTQEGNSAILQQIQYRKTGINLNIQPVVYAGRRVDLTITQEVSSSQQNTTSNIDSPIILNRQISTQLALNDGQAILLGGLISDSRSDAESGVPVLKDIPILGELFRVNKRSQDRTELVMMIVPYVIETDQEAVAITRTLRERLELLPIAENQK